MNQIQILFHRKYLIRLSNQMSLNWYKYLRNLKNLRKLKSMSLVPNHDRYWIHIFRVIWLLHKIRRGKLCEMLFRYIIFFFLLFFFHTNIFHLVLHRKVYQFVFSFLSLFLFFFSFFLHVEFTRYRERPLHLESGFLPSKTNFVQYKKRKTQ